MNTTLFTLRSSLGLTAALIGLSTGCTVQTDELAETDSVGEAAQAITYGGTLSLVRERKLSSLFGGVSADYEASGVQVLGSDLYVVFDDMNQIAKMPTSLAAGTATYTPGTLSSSSEQYEGITLDTNGTQHFYVSQEVSPGKIVQLDGAGSAQGEEYQSTGVSFSDSNKGFEGIAWVRRSNDDYLLALCEAGNCGDTTGTSIPGTIKVLRQTGSSWTVDTTISLCGNTSCTQGIFSDYSDIALFPLADGSYKVAITSQESRQLWIGNLSATTWAFTSSGTVYDYPSSGYCNVEGVTFLTATRLALASDQYTGSEPGCNDKDESMHIVDIP